MKTEERRSCGRDARLCVWPRSRTRRASGTRWKEEPDEHDLTAASEYLILLFSEAETARLVERCAIRRLSGGLLAVGVACLRGRGGDSGGIAAARGILGQ